MAARTQSNAVERVWWGQKVILIVEFRGIEFFRVRKMENLLILVILSLSIVIINMERSALLVMRRHLVHLGVTAEMEESYAMLISMMVLAIISPMILYCWR
jgi:hypothetical protein